MMDPSTRVAMTLACTDSDAIPKVADAGTIGTLDGRRVQRMHNGLQVIAGGYYGAWMEQIITGLRGHHEPQEELIFHHLLAQARPDSLIIELGAFWAYYSLWYLQAVQGARAVCVEPDPAHLQVGIANARLNGLAGRMRFVQAWAGGAWQAELNAVCESDGQPHALECLDMDAALRLADGADVEMLHLDVQGAELGFIQSMAAAVRAGRVRFMVVSTHDVSISGSATTHADCRAAIRALGGHILAEHAVAESYSGDGLIAASFAPADWRIGLPAPSRNHPLRSMFPTAAPPAAAVPAAAAAPLVSHAQNFEDVMLWRALGHVTNGFYIDIGAQDPLRDSVSLAFYARGWRGVHVEPVAEYARQLRMARPDEMVIEAAVSDAAGPLRFFSIAATGLSTGDSAIAARHRAAGQPVVERSVDCVRLADIFARHADREIHWLKIDVEGMEADVLRSWTPAPVRPWVVVVESTLPNTRTESSASWEPTLLALGYRQAYWDGLNRFYCAADHPELAAALRLGPNYFDRFQVAPSHWSAAPLAAQRDQLESGLADARAQLATREQQLEQAARAYVTLACSLDHERRNARRLAEEAAAALGRELQAVYASRSWRLTRPLRAANARFNGGAMAQLRALAPRLAGRPWLRVPAVAILRRLPGLKARMTGILFSPRPPGVAQPGGLSQAAAAPGAAPAGAPADAAPMPQPDAADLLAAAASIHANRPPIGRRQLLVDVSARVNSGDHSGIPRVVRSILMQWLRDPPAGFRVEPVRATDSGYHYARQYTLGLLGQPTGLLSDAPVDAMPGDIFVGLDYFTPAIPALAPLVRDWQDRGVQVHYVVYDLLPILRPDFFIAELPPSHRRWLEHVSTCADGLICISRAVADETHAWLRAYPPARARPLAIDWFHLGADIGASVPTHGLPADAAATLVALRGRPSFLMVGTVEPRKGCAQALAAFETLWAQAQSCDANLVIVGREGWHMEELSARLRGHREAGRRLFWLEHTSDEYLEQVYGACTVLLAASEGEGFGLPLVEAARRGLPILARDIPVFREVAGAHAAYFSGSAAADLARALRDWLALHAQGRAPASTGMPWLNWEQSARQLADTVVTRTRRYLQWQPGDRTPGPLPIQAPGLPPARSGQPAAFCRPDS